jgi:hypothetical protein
MGWILGATMLEVFEIHRACAMRRIARRVGSCSPAAALGREGPGRYRLVYRDHRGQVLRGLSYVVDLDGSVRPSPPSRVARRSPATPVPTARRVPTKVTVANPSPASPTTPTITSPQPGNARAAEAQTPEEPAPPSPHDVPSPRVEELRAAAPPAPSASTKSPRPGYDDVLPRRLRLLLGAAGISQSELARIAVLNVSHVNDVCTGRRRDPSIRTVVSIARALGCSCDWLAGCVDRGPNPAEVRAAFLNAGGRLRVARGPRP